MTETSQAHTRTRLVLCVVTAAILGFAAVVIPGYLMADQTAPAPLFPKIYTAVQNAGFISYLLLFGAGVALGVLYPEHPVTSGIASVIVFPLIAAVEKAVDLTSHAFFGKEFFWYLILAFLVSLGAVAGIVVKDIRGGKSAASQ